MNQSSMTVKLEDIDTLHAEEEEIKHNTQVLIMAGGRLKIGMTRTALKVLPLLPRLRVAIIYNAPQTLSVRMPMQSY